MKKIFTALFAITSFSVLADNPSVTIDGLKYQIFDNEYAKVSLVEEIKGDIVIKEYVDIDGKTYPVAVIGDVIGEEGQKIVLPSTAKKIWGCFGSATISVLPEGIDEIWEDNFRDVNLPEEINLPSIERLGPRVFMEAKGIKRVNIGNKLYALGADVFTGTEISEINFADRVQQAGDKFISNFAFGFMDGIKELKLPEWNGLVYGDCFAHECENLERIVFPDVATIKYGYNKYYANITLMGPSVPVYGYFFRDCPKLKEIVCLGETPIEITNIDNFKEKNIWIYNTAEEFTFMDNMDECVLKVPAGSEALYRAHPVWGRFQTILGFENGDYNLVSINSVEADENSEPVYYNLQGIQVKEPVKGQIYIRKAGAETTKVIM